MKKELLFGVGGLLIGAIIAIFAATTAVNNNNMSMMNMMGMHTDMTKGEGMTMHDMVSDLQGKAGDDFDKTFIAGMIEHHQGAIDMAELAKDNAKHQEIKDMANDIISAQSKEIKMMQTWQSEWGYDTSSDGHDMRH